MHVRELFPDVITEDLNYELKLPIPQRISHLENSIM